MRKGTKIYGILTGTCPKCQSGYVFLDKNPFHLKNMIAVNDRCSCCGLSFEPEPSFFTGAMYVSYAFSVAIVIGTFIISNLFFDDPNINYMILCGVGSALLFAPINLRFSRMIWISVFYKYDPKLAVKNTLEKN